MENATEMARSVCRRGRERPAGTEMEFELNGYYLKHIQGIHFSFFYTFFIGSTDYCNLYRIHSQKVYYRSYARDWAPKSRLLNKSELH